MTLIRLERCMGFDGFSGGDQLRSATDVRGCQVESIHGSQSMLFSLCARDLVDSLELAHHFDIKQESVVEGCLHASFVKTGFGRHFEVEES